MAIKRVYGTVDGAEVILEHADGDRWWVPVPWDRDGEYVVEIIAEDEAGNQSYMAKMLFVVNAALLCVRVIPLPYTATLQEPRYTAEIQRPRYYTELIEPECSMVRKEG